MGLIILSEETWHFFFQCERKNGYLKRMNWYWTGPFLHCFTSGPSRIYRLPGLANLCPFHVRSSSRILSRDSLIMNASWIFFEATSIWLSASVRSMYIVCKLFHFQNPSPIFFNERKRRKREKKLLESSILLTFYIFILRVVLLSGSCEKRKIFLILLYSI